MIELLREWTGLAPDECDLMPINGASVSVAFFKCGSSVDVSHDNSSSVALDVVQGAVQRAIVQRGIDFQIQPYWAKKTSWLVRVYFKNDIGWLERIAVEPSIALLTAYLAYLKQEAA